MERSTTLPGVGRKTANVVLGHALGVPGLPVDRHVLRVANRIGIAEADDPVDGRGSSCARALPPERWTRASDVADPARPPHLPAEAALRPVLGRDDCDYYRGCVVAEGARPRKARAATTQRESSR